MMDYMKQIVNPNLLPQSQRNNQKVITYTNTDQERDPIQIISKEALLKRKIETIRLKKQNRPQTVYQEEIKYGLNESLHIPSKQLKPRTRLTSNLNEYNKESTNLSFQNPILQKALQYNQSTITNKHQQQDENGLVNLNASSYINVKMINTITQSQRPMSQQPSPQNYSIIRTQLFSQQSPKRPNRGIAKQKTRINSSINEQSEQTEYLKKRRNIQRSQLHSSLNQSQLFSAITTKASDKASIIVKPFKSAKQSPRLEFQENQEHIQQQNCMRQQEDLDLLRKENNQLKDLNRKLVEELSIFRYKDDLKEAEYILDHQYNSMLVPQQYKYIFTNKLKYLKAINFNVLNEKQLIQEKANELIINTKIEFAEEVEDLYEMISLLTKQMREAHIAKDDAEAQLDFLNQDYLLQINDLNKKYNKENRERQKLEKNLLDLQKEHTQLTEKFFKLTEDHKNVTKAYTEAKENMDFQTKQIKRYQKIYNDIDINVVHEKISLLQTENSYYKNLTAKLGIQIEQIKQKARTLIARQKSIKSSSDGGNGAEDDITVNEIHMFNKTDDLRILEQEIEEDMDEKTNEVVRPEFEAQLAKAGNSLFTRF